MKQKIQEKVKQNTLPIKMLIEIIYEALEARADAITLIIGKGEVEIMLWRVEDDTLFTM